ncbi:MAG: hypothetical protein ACSHW0_04135 [Thalassotalea sp.]
MYKNILSRLEAQVAGADYSKLRTKAPVNSPEISYGYLWSRGYKFIKNLPNKQHKWTKLWAILLMATDEAAKILSLALSAHFSYLLPNIWRGILQS